MPLQGYGALVGSFLACDQEDPNHYGRWFHVLVYVRANGVVYRCAVDVDDPQGFNVAYRVVDPLDSDLFATCMNLPEGYTPLNSDATSGALDSFRSPLFQPWEAGWVDCNGEDVLNKLQFELQGAQRLWVFGEPFLHAVASDKYGATQGMHNIHVNQGEPEGEFLHENGVWQDGGVVIERQDGSLVALLNKFSEQYFPTDDLGNRAPNAGPLPKLPAPRSAPQDVPEE